MRRMKHRIFSFSCLVTRMVFIKRTRHKDANSGPHYSSRSCLRAQKTTVMAVVVIDGDQLGELAIERRAVVQQQADLIAVVGKHSQDNGARLPVGLEKAAFAIVDDRVANGWGLHVVKRAEAIGRDANAPWAWHRGVAAELG